MAKTIIHQDLKSYFGDEDHLEVSKVKSFAQMVFELLSERTPSESELHIFELVLNLSIDHGPETPSAVETIKAAKEGKTISEAVAEGVLQINERHGGAIEPCMAFLENLHGSDEPYLVKEIAEYVKDGKKLPGFGHRIYKDEDPRAEVILKHLSANTDGDLYITLLRRIGEQFEKQTGKHLPINIDGAIAAALLSFGWEAKLARAVFIIARVPGLCGQYLNAK
jgi:citrate synthase